jgi:hypothetical protein
MRIHADPDPQPCKFVKICLLNLNKRVPEKIHNFLIHEKQYRQCCGSGIPDMTFSIPDTNFFHPGSRIRIKEFKYFNPKKWFISSRKYDPGYLSRIWIRILTFYPSRIQGSKRYVPDPGSATLNIEDKELDVGADVPGAGIEAEEARGLDHAVHAN